MNAMKRTCNTTALLAALWLCACAREAPQTPVQPPQPPKAVVSVRQGQVTISGDDSISATLTWQAPIAVVTAETLAKARTLASRALHEKRLYEDAESAIPLYLAMLRLHPQDKKAKTGLDRAMAQLIDQGDAVLVDAGEDRDALQRARAVAAVARIAAPQQDSVQLYLQRVDVAERLWELNQAAEADIAAGRYGAQGEQGAVPKLREALRLQPEQPRAMQNVAAVESGLIRLAEQAAEQSDFAAAQGWLRLAARVRPDSPAIDDAHERVEQQRRLNIASLRDQGIDVLFQYNGVAQARRKLEEILRIAAPGDPVAAELRQRIDLAAHYGLFRPGQAFTDALKDGGRGPRMRVIPHGAFRMGAAVGESGAQEYEQPTRNLRFARGFAMSMYEVTVGEFGRYLQATQARTRAVRRGYSMAWDERSGNFVRRSGVDWRSDYAGAIAQDDLPVLHLSARDAEGYAQWLSAQTGKLYRLPSEAEFEYALRQGGQSIFPWGNGRPLSNTGNLTGQRDRSPTGRSWSNAFPGYADGYWGPAPVGRFRANAYGLHDLTGNVSEWMADCWHDGYRRAPKDPAAWFNPGCRMRVIRGGSWSSSPAQARSAWRAPADVDTTNAHIGFRVVRDL